MRIVDRDDGRLLFIPEPGDPLREPPSSLGGERRRGEAGGASEGRRRALMGVITNPRAPAAMVMMALWTVARPL